MLYTEKLDVKLVNIEKASKQRLFKLHIKTKLYVTQNI